MPVCPRGLRPTLVQQPFQVEYFDYDWTTDAKTSLPDRGCLRATVEKRRLWIHPFESSFVPKSRGSLLLNHSPSHQINFEFIPAHSISDQVIPPNGERATFGPDIFYETSRLVLSVFWRNIRFADRMGFDQSNRTNTSPDIISFSKTTTLGRQNARRGNIELSPVFVMNVKCKHVINIFTARSPTGDEGGVPGFISAEKYCQVLFNRFIR